MHNKWGKSRLSMEGCHKRRSSLVLPLLIILGSLASYSSGESIYQNVSGYNETVQQNSSSTSSPPGVALAIQPTGYQPIIVGPQDPKLGNRNTFFQENQEKVPSSAFLLGTGRLAQFRQTMMAYRNQITGNRFFDPDSTSVKFTLYTPKNPKTGHKIQIHNRDSIDSEFSPEKPTKIIIHGFSEIGALGEWVAQMRDAYLSTSEANIIVADFSTFETFLLFWTNLPIFASRRVADMITFLELTTGASRESFHLIARSFGTHVAGVTGRLLEGKIGRITGLEPEPRVYGSVLPDYRLMQTDAQFVDIIRVNGRRYYFHGARFGLAPPTGHVDIYPNYSERNSGCRGRTSLTYSRSNFAYCQTGRGVLYFIESIKFPDSHAICQCKSYTEYKAGSCWCNEDNSKLYMGEYLNNQTRGVFQLKTAFANQNFLQGLGFFG